MMIDYKSIDISRRVTKSNLRKYENKEDLSVIASYSGMLNGSKMMKSPTAGQPI